jgi:uncharacterized protein (TIGR02594 family)
VSECNNKALSLWPRCKMLQGIYWGRLRISRKASSSSSSPVTQEDNDMKIETSAYQVASNFLGLKEIPGSVDNPFILWCLSLTTVPKPHHDEISWCSAFANGIAYILGLPRSGSAAARSWLRVGKPVEPDDALVGLDVVIIKRGQGIQPGPEVLNAPGHVFFFGGYDGDKVKGIGGNQGDRVSLASFPKSDILGIRRLEKM